MMTSEKSASEIRDAVSAEIERLRRELDRHCLRMEISRWRVWVGALVSTSCSNCGQTIARDVTDVTVSAPEDRFGDVEGSWSYQHGCGVWNSPRRSSVELSELEDLLVDEGSEAVSDRLRALIGDVASEIDAEREANAEAVRSMLADTLREALARLAAGEDDDHVLTGDDLQPGVWRNGDELEAWDFDPTAVDGEGTITEAIVVSESDLA
jgi:hypothetical protein